MSSSGQAITATVYVFKTTDNTPITGDAANIALRLIKDGTEVTPAGSIAEVDATNCPGLYKVPLTGSENTGHFMTLHGKSTTMNSVIRPVIWTNETLPTANPGAAGGVFIAGSNADTTVNLLGTLGALSVTDYAESTLPPSASDTLLNKLLWMCTLAVTKITCSTTQEKAFAADGSTSIGTAAVSDSGSVTTRGRFGA